MAKKKMPSVIVTFQEKGISAIQRSERGILCMILNDETLADLVNYTIYSVDDIPEEMADASKEQIKLALTGYQTSPRKVLVYNVKAKDSVVDYTDVLKVLENVRFDWLVVPNITT